VVKVVSSWAELNNQLSTNAIAREVPIAAAFELTARCNFKCKMCYVCHSPSDKTISAAELTASEWIEIGKQARDSGLFFLTLTGGEVFLRSDFQEIYQAYSEMGFNITIYTNASLITTEKARWLGKIPPSKVSVTVYGASPDTYQKVTGYREGYDKTLRGIEALKEENILVLIRTTVVQDNYKEFQQLNALATRYGSELGIVNYVSPTRQDCGNNPLTARLSPELCAAYEKEAEQYKLNLNYEMTQDLAELNRKALAKEQLSNKRSAFKCQAGKCGFWINWKGYVTPCGLLDIPCEKITGDGFGAAWERLKIECLEVPICKECQECSIKEYCMSCPARLMTETGAFDKPASYLCDTARNRKLIGTKMRFYKGGENQ
jgi:radical SAM protein with 4Fe4S-binding SPASM domain